jgi:3-oxoadipate enol-lactonase
MTTAGRLRPPQISWTSRGSGPSTLVLINGYGASSLAWPRHWLRELASQQRVITPDNRGSGYSRSVDVPFTISDMAADVAAVLDDAEVSRATVLGLSMGGMVAQELAIGWPDRVAALALVATRPPVPAFRRPDLGASLALTRPVMPGETLRDFFTQLWIKASAPGFADSHPAVIAELVDQTLERPTPRMMLVQQMRAMSGWGHSDRLKHLDVPTLVVHGELDRFAPPANGRALAELIPGARLERLAGVGHLVPQEAPERLLELLGEFTPLK